MANRIKAGMNALRCVSQKLGPNMATKNFARMRLMSTTTIMKSTTNSTAVKWIAGGIGATVIYSGYNMSKAEASTSTEGTTETSSEPSLFKKCVAEAIGTGMIVGGGCGTVAAAKYAGSGLGLAGIALGFGASVALAIFTTANVSGAHLNPAVTVSLAINKPEACPPEIIVPYIFSQCVGAAIASIGTFFTFSNGIKAMESAQKVVRGSGLASAQIFEGAFGIIPNSAMLRAPGVLVAEIGLTAALAFMIFAVTDENNAAIPAGAAPILIGATVSTLIVQGAPVCGAGMNPARDLGPRFVSMIAGLGKHSLTPAWWAYTIGPIIGAVLGGAAYNAALKNKF